MRREHCCCAGGANQSTYHPRHPQVERRDFIRLFSQAQFLAAAGRAADLPPPGPPEIAFAGRSNVGKSSAINALLGRRALARTSKTPGRTQTINLYSLGQEGEMRARLADLPGYGYAKVPQAQRAQWRQLVGDYLESRPTLAGVVVIMDARHPFMPLDRQLLQWLGDLRTLVVLSKADKLSRAEQAALEKDHREALLFSSSTKQGVEECRALLEGWIQQGAEIKSPR
ncbi:MAG TPA: ribosome biogenesis GTP-binding protein YihA/YsxC [Burkholderiales bacterium]